MTFSSSIWPIFSFNLLLSIVLICSAKITESLFNPQVLQSTSICVGSFALLVCDVIAAAITVGLYLFPKSFCIITTGRIPPCSEPITGLKSA